jgi:hypothetical protein
MLPMEAIGQMHMEPFALVAQAAELQKAKAEFPRI